MKALMKVLFISVIMGTIGCGSNNLEKADIVKNSEVDWVEETAVIETTYESIEVPEVTETTTEDQKITTTMPATVAEIVTTMTTAAATTTTAVTENNDEIVEMEYDSHKIFAKKVINIRVAPSTDSKVIGKTRKNEEFQCIGKDGNWYIVMYEGIPAYVYASYFSDTPIPLVDKSVDDPYTYYEMEADIEVLKSKYVDNLSVDIIGKSYDNRNLYLLTLGNPDAEKSVLFTASIHGAEYITSQLVMAHTEYYLANMTEKYNGKTIKEILDDVCIYIMPMVNPDSVCISQYGFSIINDDTLRAKLFKLDYTDTWSSNARGVDINRNFPTDGFGKENADNQGSSKPSFKYYEGEYAGSETETQVIMEFVESHPTLMAFISYHSKGEVIYWNKGQTGTLYKNTKKMAELIADITDYRSVEYLQVKSGIDYEWAILEAGLAGCTIEIGDIESWFPVRQTQWKDIWKRNKYVMIAVADLFEELKR